MTLFPSHSSVRKNRLHQALDRISSGKAVYLRNIERSEVVRRLRPLVLIDHEGAMVLNARGREKLHQMRMEHEVLMVERKARRMKT